MYHNFTESGSIAGVGIDTTDISRFQRMRENIRMRLAKRILGETEYKMYISDPFPEKRLAVFFSAKESVAKALGTGFQGIAFRDILISYDSMHCPCVYLSERAGKIAEKRGIRTIHLSITHEGPLVTVISVAAK